VELIATVAELRARLDAERCAGRTIGFVPTMGALHEGHLSLVGRAAADTDVAVISIFVNPLQFGPGEDFARYPRDLEADAAMAAGAGARLAFAPSVEEMYGEGAVTSVSVARLTAGLEGASRPGHFDGVATVVTKLFAAVGPCRAYFGEKDYQQLQVVRRLARDLSLPVDVVGCRTVRERDGLAMSSRNAYLDPPAREAAAVLHRALMAGAAAVKAGERDPAAVRDLVHDVAAAEPLVEVDYVALVDAHDLDPPAAVAGELRLLVAARVGGIRLIDNLGITVDP
jgi:pantoate--beta-alanine ligase